MQHPPRIEGNKISIKHLTMSFKAIQQVLLFTPVYVLKSTIVRFTLLALVILQLASCVPNRKYMYLQKHDVNAKELPKDTIVRSYSIQQFTYRVQPNDILNVRFESLTEKEYNFFSANQPSGASTAQGGTGALLLGEMVDNNGDILFPVIGKVKVQGLTIFEIQEKLQDLAGQYIETPIVKVRLLNFRITLLGEVAREGSLTLGNNRVTMLEAIGQAGGLGELADRSNIKLIRQTGSQLDIQYINVLDENFINSPYYYVNQNDILIVPPLRQRPFRKYFGSNLAIIFSSISLLLLAINLSTK